MVVSERSSKKLTCQKDNAVLVRVEKVLGICPVEVTFVSGVQTFTEALCRAALSLLDTLQKALSLVL